jgi:hypothetical protein
MNQAVTIPELIQLIPFRIYFQLFTVHHATISPIHSPWSWTLLEKLPIVQLLKNFPVFYGTRRFITAFTRALYLFLS